jgi:DNA repair protein SbcC/Rad50
LKTLLGLEIYDRMRELAGDRRNRLRAEEDAGQGVIERDYANANEEHLETMNADLRRVSEQQEENASRAKRAEELFGVGTELRRNRNSLADQERARTQVQTDYLNAFAVVTEKSSEVDRIRQAIDRADADLAAVTVDDGHYAQLLKLNERSATLTQLQRSRTVALKTREGAQAELEITRNELTAARENAKQAEILRIEADKARQHARDHLAERVARGSADRLEGLIDILLKEFPSKRQLVIDLGDQKVRLLGEGESLREEITKHESDRVATQAALEKAKVEQEHLTIQNTHRQLRAGLKKGEPCPVCEQVVTVLPKIPAASALEAAKARVTKADGALREIRNAITRAQSQVEAVPGRLHEIDDRIAEATAAIERATKQVHAVTGEMSDAECLKALNRAVAEIRAAETELKVSEGRLGKADTASRSAAEGTARLDNEVTKLSERVAGCDKELRGLGTQIEEIRPEIDSAGGSERITFDLKAINEAKQKRDRLTADQKKLASDLQNAQDSKSKAELDVAVFNERIRELGAKIEQLGTAIGNLVKSWSRLEEGFGLPPGGDEPDRAEKKRRELEDERLRISGESVRLEAAIKDIETKITHLAELQKRQEEVRAERNLYEQLATALRADRFIAYLLETAYADLCAKGSEHLMRVSQQRYSFTAGKNEFCVKDGWNADAERSASTLSGGESFLASLALALALADSVASFGADGGPGTKLEALFLDEGVSTLDQDETLPAVIEALTSLQTGDRMVGVISHMENLAERLPARIEVVNNHGRSSLRATDAAILTVGLT